MTWVVYSLENILDGRKYIGMTSDMEMRLKWHRSATKSRKTPLYMAIQTFGWGGFRAKILAECESQWEAAVCERAMIAQYGTFHTAHGYNMSDGGDFMPTLHKRTVRGAQTKEHKNAIGAGNRRAYSAPEAKIRKSESTKKAWAKASYDLRQSANEKLRTKALARHAAMTAEERAALAQKKVIGAKRARASWTPEQVENHRQKVSAGSKKGNASRWARFATMTPEERAAYGARMSEAKKTAFRLKKSMNSMEAN